MISKEMQFELAKIDQEQVYLLMDIALDNDAIVDMDVRNLLADTQLKIYQTLAEINPDYNPQVEALKTIVDHFDQGNRLPALHYIFREAIRQPGDNLNTASLWTKCADVLVSSEIPLLQGEKSTDEKYDYAKSLIEQMPVNPIGVKGALLDSIAFNFNISKDLEDLDELILDGQVEEQLGSNLDESLEILCEPKVRLWMIRQYCQENPAEINEKTAYDLFDVHLKIDQENSIYEEGKWKEILTNAINKKLNIVQNWELHRPNAFRILLLQGLDESANMDTYIRCADSLVYKPFYPQPEMYDAEIVSIVERLADYEARGETAIKNIWEVYRNALLFNKSLLDNPQGDKHLAKNLVKSYELLLPTDSE